MFYVIASIAVFFSMVVAYCTVLWLEKRIDD